jgi:hypothetical protein
MIMVIMARGLECRFMKIKNTIHRREAESAEKTNIFPEANKKIMTGLNRDGHSAIITGIT